MAISSSAKAARALAACALARALTAADMDDLDPLDEPECRERLSDIPLSVVNISLEFVFKLCCPQCLSLLEQPANSFIHCFRKKANQDAVAFPLFNEERFNCNKV